MSRGFLILLFVYFAALVLLAKATYGQNHPQGLPVSTDEYSLTCLNPNFCIIEYYNSIDQSSAYAPQELRNDPHGLVVELELDITAGPEILSATPSEGWIAEPPDVTVEDGDIGVIELRRGTYRGS